MDVDPKKILIATQGSTKEPFRTEIKNLFKSINTLGGQLKNVQKIAVFSEPVDALLVEELLNIDVKASIKEEIDTRCVHANKIQMLDTEFYDDYDYLIALDADTVVCNDFLSIINGTFQAKPVDHDPLTIEQWNKMFSFFDLDLPTKRYLTHFLRQKTIPYFNSGVLIIPKQYVSELYDSWKGFVKKLLESYSELGDISQYSFFTDQFALSLALFKNHIPFTELPLEMNFPTHNKIHPSFKPESMSPYVIHYHHNLNDDGTILYCTYEKPNHVIDKVNDVLRKQNHKIEHLEFFNPKFDNKSFWNDRYANNLQLGSGMGSRGIYVDYKRKIIQNIISSFLPKSILDVGCGDIEIIKKLDLSDYTGIDISEKIIQRNKTLKPEWQFMAGDFLNLQLGVDKFDMVMSFDVLIHQHSYKQYSNFVNKLSKHCNRVGLISGYEWLPRKAFLSDAVSFFEPLSVTLKKCGVKNSKILGVYRDTCIFLFEK